MPSTSSLAVENTWEQVGWMLNLEGALAAGVDVEALGSPSPVVPGFSERISVVQMADPDAGWLFVLDAKILTRLAYALAPGLDDAFDNNRGMTRVLEATLPFSPFVAARWGMLFTVGPLRLGAGPALDFGFVGVNPQGGGTTYEIAMGVGADFHLAYIVNRDFLILFNAGPTYHLAFRPGFFSSQRLRAELAMQYRFTDYFGLFGFLATPAYLPLPTVGDDGTTASPPYGFARLGLGIIFGF